MPHSGDGRRPGAGRRSRPPVPRIDSEIPKVYDEEGTETDQTGVIAPKSFRGARRPTIMAMSGTLAGSVFRLDKPRISLGRARAADIVVVDEGVSRIHCVITRLAEAQFSIEDQRSTNGTLVNGRSVTQAELTAGDRIQVGSLAVFQFGYFDEAEEELAKNMYDGATRDPLTRALNRRHFFERFAAEISYATRHEEKLAVVLFDVDHFKSVNDSYGHAGGDFVLKRIGVTIGSLLRTEDIFARYGGEEFVVVARGLSLKQGAKLAERIRTAVENAVLVFEKHRFRVTISAGVAELSEAADAKSAEKLLMLADGRLYSAKSQGRNKTVAR